jgi:hypothetical protein
VIDLSKGKLRSTGCDVNSSRHFSGLRSFELRSEVDEQYNSLSLGTKAGIRSFSSDTTGELIDSLGS